jgi:putative PIN family toxin of toxin-antitoxin system
MTQPSAVFDCMVFLQAVVSPRGPAFRCLEKVWQGDVRLLLSPSILYEIQDVLGRPELQLKWSQLRPERVTPFLQQVTSIAALQPDPTHAFPLPRDPDDQIYTDLAIAAGADYLVTWNDRHLTYLMRQDTPEGIDFCRRFPKLKIVDPVTFLRAVDPPNPAVPPAP